MVYRLVVLLVLALALRAASPTLAKPESAGMSSERLLRIGAWLSSVVEQKQAAGFVTIVSRRDKVVHHEAHGARGMTVADQDAA